MLWDSLTVEEHVKLWANIKRAGNEHFDDGKIISECDLWKKRSARSSTLSGGMKRKLQLAIMLVGGSTVCCLDEATSGLVYPPHIHMMILELMRFAIGPIVTAEDPRDNFSEPWQAHNLVHDPLP